MDKREVLSGSLSLTAYLDKISDSRFQGYCLHNLSDILAIIALIEVIGGAETFTEIEQYGEEKEEWFKTFLELPGGIPSHDTFNRVF